MGKYMRILLATLLASVLLASGPEAQESDEATGLTEIMTAYEARGWEGVGLVSIGHGGMCTGALIETNVVEAEIHNRPGRLRIQIRRLGVGEEVAQIRTDYDQGFRTAPKDSQDLRFLLREIRRRQGLDPADGGAGSD